MKLKVSSLQPCEKKDRKILILYKFHPLGSRFQIVFANGPEGKQRFIRVPPDALAVRKHKVGPIVRLGGPPVHEDAVRPVHPLPGIR